MDRPEYRMSDDGTASKWIDAVLWKFCDPDNLPQDR